MSAEHRVDLDAQLREADRGEVAAWAAYPADAWWRPVAIGLWAAAFVLAHHPALDGAGDLARLGLVLLPLGFVLWERRHAGAYPQGSMPRELSRSTWALVNGLAVTVAVSVAAYLVLPLGWAAVVAGAGAATTAYGYGRTYRADVVRVRRRLR